MNLIVNHTNTFSAHQERVFIEHRLEGVQADLERAQLEMSESSTHTAIDIKEQTRATVEAAAKLQAQLIIETRARFRQTDLWRQQCSRSRGARANGRVTTRARQDEWTLRAAAI